MLAPILCDVRCGRTAVARVVATWGPYRSRILHACELHRLDVRRLAEHLKVEGQPCKFISEQRLFV
jgi:hypothetical protein